jgi:phytoene/squalene synthetase
LIKNQVSRTWKYFEEGRNLIPLLPGNFKRQIKMTIFGGEEILNKIESQNFDVINKRPILRKIDYIKIMIKSIFA